MTDAIFGADMHTCACCEREVKLGDIVWPAEAQRHWFWFSCSQCAVEGREPKDWMEEFIQFYRLEGQDAETGTLLERFSRVLSNFERVDSVDDVAGIAELAPTKS